MAKLKKTLFSENGMKVVNTLFLLVVFFRSNLVSIIAYGVWLLYLAYSIRHTQSRAMRTAYGIMTVYAAVVIILNIYLLAA